jgi:carboxylesterase type B
VAFHRGTVERSTRARILLYVVGTAYQAELFGMPLIHLAYNSYSIGDVQNETNVVFVSANYRLSSFGMCSGVVWHWVAVLLM